MPASRPTRPRALSLALQPEDQYCSSGHPSMNRNGNSDSRMELKVYIFFAREGDLTRYTRDSTTCEPLNRVYNGLWGWDITDLIEARCVTIRRNREEV